MKYLLILLILMCIPLYAQYYNPDPGSTSRAIDRQTQELRRQYLEMKKEVERLRQEEAARQRRENEREYYRLREYRMRHFPFEDD